MQLKSNCVFQLHFLKYHWYILWGINSRGGGWTTGSELRHSLDSKQRNWVFATNSNIPIPISWQPNVVDLRYFKLLILLDQIIVSLKYERVKPTGCRDIEVRKFEVVAKTQFLRIRNGNLKKNLCLQPMETQIFHNVIFVLTARIINFCKTLLL